MNHLDKLAISNRIMPTPPRRPARDTTQYRRAKLIANIEEQIELVKLSLENKPLQLERKRGHQIKMVRPRIWWHIDPDGNVLSQIRYNKVPLILAGIGTSIETQSLNELQQAYKIVVEATEAGELDQAILSAAKKSTTESPPERRHTLG